MSSFLMNLFYIFLFYFFFYFCKIHITIGIKNDTLSITLYIVIIAASLAFLRLEALEQIDHHKSDIYYIYYWIGLPIHFLAIPTVTYIYDLTRRGRCYIQSLIIRSAIEIIILFPIWFVIIFSYLALLAGFLVVDTRLLIEL